MLKKLTGIILLLMQLSTLLAQDHAQIDRSVKATDSLLQAKALLRKDYPGRTFAGALSAYYDQEQLVLIKTLTDGEMGGTETIYYLNKDSLIKVYSMAVSFKDPKEWDGYQQRHQQNKHCRQCHQKKNCQQTTLYFGNTPSRLYKIDDRASQVSAADTTKELADTKETYALLHSLLEEWQGSGWQEK